MHQQPRRMVCVVEGFSDGSVYEVPQEEEDDDGEVKKWNPSLLTAVVVGAGPTGLIAALYLAKRGYKVAVYDKGPKPQEGDSATKPLVMSARAAAAVDELGLELLSMGPNAQPLRGVWDLGQRTLAPLDDLNAFRRSYVVDRSGLAAELVAEAERLYPTNITFHFGTGLRCLDFKQRTAIFTPAAAMEGSGSPAPLLTTSATTGSSRSRAPSTAVLPKGDDDMFSSRDQAVAYDLIIGADGADSTLRRLMESKVKDFFVQAPMTEVQGIKVLSKLPPLPPGQEPVPGFNSHGPQEYLYRYSTPGGPRILLWRDVHDQLNGSISGVDSWEEDALATQLAATYGDRLPAMWRSAIAYQAGTATQPTAQSSRIVQCTQFHGPRAVLVGSAAHAVTDELQQGPSAAIESVRTLHLVLRGSGDDLNRVPEVYSNVRGEAITALQFMEMMTATSAKGSGKHLKYGHWMFALSAHLAQLYWATARAVGAFLHALLPKRFLAAAQVLDALRDRRIGYGEVSRMIQGYAAPPFIVIICLVAAQIIRGYMRRLATL